MGTGKIGGDCAMTITANNLPGLPPVTRLDWQIAGQPVPLFFAEIPSAEDTRTDYIQQYKAWLPSPLVSANASRQAEFITGRLCSAAALAVQGIEHHVVGSNTDRSPIWPGGVRGAISHKNHLAVAVASNNAQFVGVDLEVELSASRIARIKSKIIDQQEMAVLEAADIDFVAGFTLVFSAKETLYKAIYPFVKRYLGFSTSKLTGFTDDTLTLELRPDIAQFVPHPASFSIKHRHFRDFRLTLLISNPPV